MLSPCPSLNLQTGLRYFTGQLETNADTRSRRSSVEQNVRTPYKWTGISTSLTFLSCTGPLRVVACGGGISGVNLAKLLPERLSNVSLTIYDMNEELGGTWLLNRYVHLHFGVYIVFSLEVLILVDAPQPN
jgi:hypothetical protein